MIVCDDVLHWAETYTGEPFHGLLSDPPYELNFMGRDWDRSGIAFRPETWKALAQHLFPGAFGMCFASSRGWHRLACAIEDAGLILHPSIFMLGWLQGSGFPKATRIDTAIDKAAGAERERVGRRVRLGDKRDYDTHGKSIFAGSDTGNLTAPATPMAAAWAGHRYGLQALKPALEPILLWSKPGICYNELKELVEDCTLLFEDLWTRFADSADTITKAESIVRSALSTVETSIARNGEHTSVNAAGSNLHGESQRSKKEEEPTALRNAKTLKQANGSTVPTAETLPINGPPSSSQDEPTTTVVNAVTQPTETNSEQELVSNAGSNSLLLDATGIASTVPPPVDTPQKNDPSSKTRYEMVTDIDIRMGILRYNSEKAKYDLSTIWLWRITWDALWSEGNTSTIAMTAKTTTLLRTLSSALRRLMRESRDTVSTKNSSTSLWSYASDVNSHFIGLLTCLTISKPTASPVNLSPILMFQKPYAGRPVDCIARTGAGALWIEGARLPGPEPHHNYGRTSGATSFAGPSDEPFNTPSSGRWPPNLCLVHTADCQPTGTRQVRGSHDGVSQGTSGSAFFGLHEHAPVGHTAPDGTETVTAWDCAPDCPVVALDAQAGERASGQPSGVRQVQSTTFGQCRPGGSLTGYGDTGSASRFFPQFGWQDDIAERLETTAPAFYAAKASRRERDAGLPTHNVHPTVKPLSLLRWLATLLLPPVSYAPRRLLVPFGGSGSECIAARLVGWEQVVGIEDSAEYVALAQARVRHWLGMFAAMEVPA